MPHTCHPVSLDKIRVPTTARTFALEVKGDGLEGLHIRAGDIVVCEHGAVPAPGDLIAALADDESFLAVWVHRKGGAFLKTGPEQAPDYLPAKDALQQGVVRQVVRCCQTRSPGR